LGQKAAPDDPQGTSFALFTAMRVGIDRHAPEQRRSRRDLDEAVHAETHEGNGPR
jgi:hypothetical protein